MIEVLKFTFLMLVAISVTLILIIPFDEIGILIPESDDLADWIIAIFCGLLVFFCAVIVTVLLANAIY